MEKVLANTYMNIKSKPEFKRITKRGNYMVEIEVEKYSDEYFDKQDLIKIVTVNVEYKLKNSNQVYKLSTLATK